MTSPHNPYTAPEAHVADVSATAGETEEFVPEGLRVPANRGAAWITTSWRMLIDRFSEWRLFIILFSIIFLLLQLPQLLPSTVATIVAVISFVIYQYVLVIPIAAGIIYAAHTQYEYHAQQPKLTTYLLAGFGDRFSTLLGFGLLNLVLTIVAALLSILVLIVTASDSNIWSILQNIEEADPAAVAEIVLPLLLALLVWVALTIPIFMGAWFVIPLIIGHDMGPWTAFKASFSGCIKNILPFLMYSLVCMGYLVGLIVVAGLISAVISQIPVLGVVYEWVLSPILQGFLTVFLCITVYVGYRDIFYDA